MVTRMVRHYDQDERQSDASLHWDAIRPVLLKAFAKHGARTFSDEQEYCEDPQNSLAYFRAIHGHSGGRSSGPELMEYIRIPYNWTEFIFQRGCPSSIQSILENGLIPGGKESDKGRQTVFFTPLNSFGGDSDEEETGDGHTVPQKVHYQSHWKRNQDAVHWVKLSRAQDQRIAFLASEVTCNHRTRSHRVISQNGDRTLFERLSTSRPAPKVKLKSNWHSQQQQSICDDVSTSTRKLVTEP